MRVLVTGHQGYIGSVLTPRLVEAGHDVVGLDSGLFADGILGDPPPEIPSIDLDVRDVTPALLQGFEAVIHLAGISNDPLGDLEPVCTDEINHLASVRLASLARKVGVPRFLFASSCSLYGAAGELEALKEAAPFNPVTPYGESKVRVEEAVSKLADDDFSPTFLRCGTAYGASPRLRADLVVNNLLGHAMTEGTVLLKSDGSPWRPLVHVEDVARAYQAVLEAPRELVHGQAFNVGRSGENYRIREVARIVQEAVPGSLIAFAEGARPDQRCYRVDCSKLETTLPDWNPRWTVRRGVLQLRDAYEQGGLTWESFTGPRYLRIGRILDLQHAGRIGSDLRWRSSQAAAAGSA